MPPVLRIQGPEPAIQAILTRLNDPTTGINAYIDLVNALSYVVADGDTLLYPAKIVDRLPTSHSLTDFPTIGIGQIAGTFEDDIAWTATGVWPIVVMGFVQASDGTTLAHVARRYLLALANCVLQNRSFASPAGATTPGTPWGLRLRAYDTGPTTADTPPLDDKSVRQRLWTYCALLFEARQDEA